MAHYDEIEIEDMDWSDELNAFTYSCPCGDLFQITVVRLLPPRCCCGLHMEVFSGGSGSSLAPV